jgi:hypothetical protein
MDMRRSGAGAAVRLLRHHGAPKRAYCTRVEDVVFAADGTGTALVRCSRTDQTGERRWINLPDEKVAAMSWHSIGVGATQDLLALNIDLTLVIQAVGWKSTHMPIDTASMHSRHEAE